MENNKDLIDIDINKIYSKLNDNLDFKFEDLSDDIIIEDNSDNENKIDNEIYDTIIEKNDALELEGKKLEDLDGDIINVNNNK